MKHGVLRGRNEAGGIVERRFRVHQHPHALIHAVVAGRAREDGVEVGRKALRLLECHAPPAGATVEVGQLRRHAVEVRDRRLALRRGLVHRTVAEVFQLLRVTHREARIGARMAGIGYPRGDHGEVVYCTPGIREYHQHSSHRGEQHPKSAWKLARVIWLTWKYLYDSGSYAGRGGV